MNVSVSLIFPVLLIAGLLCFFCYYIHAMTPRKGTLEWIARAETCGGRRKFSFTVPLHPMEKKDALPLILLTAFYAVSAFWNLGSTTNPQSFLNMQYNDTVSFSTSETVSLSRVTYYSGLWTGTYILDYSTDGVNWESMELDQPYSRLFYWRDAELPEGQPVSGKFFQLTAVCDRGQIELGELALFDENGTLVSVRTDTATPLFDEQDTVPDAPHWMNSAYFDEIYHARTAYEHYRNVDPYEDTHPPLGKIIIMLGIHLFGMNPFGWRFMGTLFGVLMVPILYIFLKNIFGKTAVALCGAALFTFDFMHLVQTRIATIDSYGVFFILAMFYFLYRYLALPAGTPLYKCTPSLFLCGLMFGLGVSSKWIVLYGGAGMALLYFIALFWKCREWPESADAPRRGLWVFGNILFCIFSFVLIPSVIYVLSYIPYATANGVTDLKGLLEIVWENQTFMLTYHQGVMDEHPYSSRWYQWLLDIRPILYYMDNETVGFTARFASFNNPLVTWGGLAAIVTVAVQTVRRSCGKGLFILLGALSQFMPWIIIGRTTFAYHYFPTVVFLCIAFAYVMNDLAESGRRWKPAVCSVTGGAVALYVLFYPALIGYQVPVWFMKSFIKWFPSWPF